MEIKLKDWQKEILENMPEKVVINNRRKSGKYQLKRNIAERKAKWEVMCDLLEDAPMYDDPEKWEDK